MRDIEKRRWCRDLEACFNSIFLNRLGRVKPYGLLTADASLSPAC